MSEASAGFLRTTSNMNKNMSVLVKSGPDSCVVLRMLSRSSCNPAPTRSVIHSVSYFEALKLRILAGSRSRPVLLRSAAALSHAGRCLDAGRSRGHEAVNWAGGIEIQKRAFKKVRRVLGRSLIGELKQEALGGLLSLIVSKHAR